VYNGNLTVSTPGAVIDGLDIRGFVRVTAPNVTIRRSIIRGPATAPTVNSGLLSIVAAGASGFLIEDVQLLPQVVSGYIDGVKVNQAGTFRRVDISGTSDGMVIYGDGVSVLNSFIHDLVHLESDPAWGGKPSHDDAIQVQAGRNVSILSNTLEGAYNAAVMVTQDVGVTQNLKINENWLDGGGCTLNYKTNGAYKTGMQANDNRFGRVRRVANCAIIHNAAASDLVPTGNVWDDNGQPATIKSGA
jgi:nitrous oxidase accessory protein NosD